MNRIAPGSYGRHRNELPCPVSVDDRGADWRKPREPRDGRARLFTHQVVQRAPDQQEKQKGRSGVKIGVRRAMKGIVEAKAEGERHTDRDRNVHVRSAATQRRPRREIKDPSGIKNGRKRQRGRNEMKRLPRSSIGSRPDGYGQQHDVHGAEARHRQRLEKTRQFGILGVGLERKQMRRVADPLQCADQVWRGAPIRVPSDSNPLCGQVNSRSRHAIECRKVFSTVAMQAPQRMPGHRKVGLAGAVAQIAAGEQDFRGRGRWPSVDFKPGMGGE